MRCRFACVFLMLAVGCTRTYYRNSADNETYPVIVQHEQNPAWALPRISIDPAPQSRLFDPFNPDHPPMPPDDQAADQYMRCVEGMHAYRHWHKDGDAPWIEDPAWRQALGLNGDAELALSPERSIELALINSREYQTALELIYQNALTLTLNRYEFFLHYFATNDTTWTHFGSSDTESNTLTTSSTFGFTKAFAAGGQLLVEFANSFVFEFSGPDHTVATSNIMINFVQPLLRGGGRVVRLENLTEAERSLLYAVRAFAHFRKQFSFNIITNTYLQLLLQAQTIRNQEVNLASLEQSLRLHESLLETGSISAIDVDQVFQTYQAGRLSLLTAQAGLQQTLDAYKISLGLPPTIRVKLDESILDPFQLNDPALDKIQNGLESLLAEYREMNEPPSLERMRMGLDRLRGFHKRDLDQAKKVRAELARWLAQPADPNIDATQAVRTLQTKRALQTRLPAAEQELSDLTLSIESLGGTLARAKPKDGWELLQKRIREESAMAYELSIIETQIRVFLIQLRPVNYKEPDAIAYALNNRLDLMNERGRVVDQWRQIAVAANALKGVANVNFAANIATPPGGSNPVDFRASASSYTVGFHLEAPLNREAERNTYRLSLINYENERRSFMALEDSVAQAIRQDLRQLETQRLSFEISRQSLLGAARTVDAARDKLLSVETAGTTATLNLLNSLNNLLQAKQGLITNWVAYETTRVQLLLDLEQLQVDERGLYIDEPNKQPDQSEKPERLPDPRSLPDLDGG